MTCFRKKEINIKRDKLILSSVAIFLSIYFAFSCTYFACASQSVREDVVRLHILANSNSSFDQEIKLKVRDALLQEDFCFFGEVLTVENAEECFEQSKGKVIKVCEKVLEENGIKYNAAIFLEKEYYETRCYGSLTFPAGEYLSLKIILGEGKGENWWCVMFPPLCVPAAADVASDKETASQYLSEGGETVVNGDGKYTVKFKIVEIFEELKYKLGF